ncbi:hypothetical protein HZY86_00920 [Aerococcaceae bacterium DSM 111020]|nr:hypothetical protein [Aerococcaceae bacterium DSM 111020]
MNNKNNNYSKQIEEEIQKQLNEVDRRVDRGGWPSLLIIIVLLFLGLYLITTFIFPDNSASITYEDRAESLEQQIESLETRIEQLENNE